MMLNRRSLNPAFVQYVLCGSLRMMLNRRSLNRYRRKVDYVCSLRMMLNRRPLNQIESVYEMEVEFENDVKQ